LSEQNRPERTVLFLSVKENFGAYIIPAPTHYPDDRRKLEEGLNAALYPSLQHSNLVVKA
jgi:hypothetical protein